MITFQQIVPPVLADKEDYAVIEARINSTYSNVENLGLCSDGINSIYGVPFGDPTKPCIFVDSTIHGNEWESTYWCLHLLDCLIDPTLASEEVQPYFEYFAEKYHFYFIPILNPSGWIADTREITGGIDPNRTFDLDLYPENTIPKAKILEKKPVLFLDNHTATQPNETVGLGGNSGIDYSIMTQDLIYSLRYIRGHRYVDWYPVSPIQTDMAIGRGWASNQMSSTGRKTMCILFEGRKPDTLQTKVTMGFNGLLLALLYADRYFKRGVLR